MTNLKKQDGFALIEATLIIVVIAAIGFVGYKVFNKNNQAIVSNITTQSQSPFPVKINSKSDVSQSIKALDSTPINSELDPGQLDSSISSLL